MISDEKTIWQKIFAKLARIQCKYTIPVFIVFILFTSLMIVGFSNITLQTDISKELPQELLAPQKESDNELGGNEALLILVYIDKENTFQNNIADIRDSQVICSIADLHERLMDNPRITSVTSIASIFTSIEIPETKDGIIYILQQVPQSNQFFNKDYSATTMYVYTSGVDSDEKIERLVTDIQQEIDSVEKPSGLKTSVTGDAQTRNDLCHLMREDMVLTMMIAIVLIVLFLICIFRNATKVLLTMLPLIFALVWIFGTMGLLNMPISIVTIAIGAMIIGLGVEYGLFLFRRYAEERTRGVSAEEAVSTAVPMMGPAIFGSSTTTIAGFLSLVLATMPMIRSLGFLLALGILYSLISTLCFAPVLYLLVDKISKRMKRKKGENGRHTGSSVSHLQRVILEKYAHFIVKKPTAVLLVVFLITGCSLIGIANIHSTGMNYADMLPSSMESVQALELYQEEFGADSSVLSISLRVDPKYGSSNEVRDIRDPRVILYLDRLEQQIKQLDGVVSVYSLAALLKENNNGSLPQNGAEIIHLMKTDMQVTTTLPSTLEVLSSAAEGIGKIQQGIRTDELQQMTAGFEQLIDGVNILNTSLLLVRNGTYSEADALGNISAGLQDITDGLETINSNLLLMQSGLSSLSSLDMSQLTFLMDLLQTEIMSSSANATQQTTMLTYLGGIQLGVNTLVSSIEENASLMAYGLGLISENITVIADALDEIQGGGTQLQDVSTQLGDGLINISGGIGVIKYALIEINTSASQYGSQFTALDDSLGEIKDALDYVIQYETIFGEQTDASDEIHSNTFEQYISDDYCLTVIRVQHVLMDEKQSNDFINNVNSIVDENERPVGTTVNIFSYNIFFKELEEQIIPIMSGTAITALFAILVIVILLFFSIRYGLISLLAIGLGLVWAVGIQSFAGIEMTFITSAGIAMIMGVGIDFGIQIVTRFREELKKHDLEYALSETMVHIIGSMTITTFTILLGFRAMTMGRIIFISGLANMFSIGVLTCFAAAITIIPTALVFNEKYKT
ncbi:MAG: efflux RND transporter permease subunit [Candidatus Celaenobacter antarcticus]|nr:efflux RND transporter permease subunit [Candidatus Celaenobacter antarcticus]